MFAKSKQCDVLVVGAGPVGQLLALLLTKQGISVEVVDEAWRSTGRSYAAAIHPASLEILAEIGLVEAVVSAAQRIDRVSFYDGPDRKLALELGELESEYPFLAVLPQSSLESMLEEQLKLQNVTIHWQHRASAIEQSAHEVQAEVDVLERVSTGYAYATSTLEIAKTIDVRSRIVVGADGYASLVRRGQQIVYEQMDEAEEYDVFEFQSSRDTSGEVCIVLNDDSTNVLWPLPGGRQRWSFQVGTSSIQRERVKSRLAMQVPGEASPKYTAAYLKEMITKRAPWFAAEVGDIAWAGDVRFEYRLAQSFGTDRIWLLGDSAHQTAPVGVQSMNHGLLEAVDLAARICKSLGAGQDFAALHEYGSQQRANWVRLINGSKGLASDSNENEWLAKRARRVARALPVSGRHHAEVCRKLGLQQ